MSNNISKLAQALIVALQPFADAADTTSIGDASNAFKAPEGGQPAPGEFDVWGLSSCKDYYIPWNEKIHASTKAINADGTLKKVRGVQPKTFNEVEGEWLDKHGLEVTEYELVDGQPVAIGGDNITETEEKPSKPGKPGKPGKPAPSKPGKPKTVDTKDRDAAVKHINHLVSTHGVDYDFLIEQLLDKHGVEAFDDLPPEADKEILTEAKAWDDFLNLITKFTDQIRKWDEEYGDDVMEGVDQLIVEAGGDAEQGIATVPRAGLSGLYDEIKDQHDQWANYYKEA